MVEKGRALVLRTVSADMTSRGGFVWPETGPVECADWDETPKCGHGLHGLLWGRGIGELLDWSECAKWLVVEVEEWVEIGGKVKFPRGVVLHCGDLESALSALKENGGALDGVVGVTATAGDMGTATAGDRGTATAGDMGMLLIRRWNGKRYRFHVANVGEDGIKPNVAYRLGDGGGFVEVAE